MKSALIVISSALLLGCTKAGLWLANFPVKLGDTEVIRDIAFGPEHRQKLDIYLPAGSESARFPVVVFFYGGSWTEGSKSMYAFVGQSFAKNNYIAVIADYRKYPEVKFPAFVEDGAKAIAWTQKNIAQYGGNERLYLSGHSAGAHIGALIAADERYLAAEGMDTSLITAFAGLSGPYDFIPKEEKYKRIFGPPENYDQMQVTTFIEGTEPPMLLLWGSADTLVGKHNMDLLAAKIADKNGRVETKIYDNIGHAEMVSGMVWYLPQEAPVLVDIIDFFSKMAEPN